VRILVALRNRFHLDLVAADFLRERSRSVVAVMTFNFWLLPSWAKAELPKR
jgi:hypothetical protein